MNCDGTLGELVGKYPVLSTANIPLKLPMYKILRHENSAGEFKSGPSAAITGSRQREKKIVYHMDCLFLQSKKCQKQNLLSGIFILKMIYSRIPISNSMYLLQYNTQVYITPYIIHYIHTYIYKRITSFFAQCFLHIDFGNIKYSNGLINPPPLFVKTTCKNSKQNCIYRGYAMRFRKWSLDSIQPSRPLQSQITLLHP